LHEVDGMNEPCHMEAFVFKKSTHEWKIISYYIKNQWNWQHGWWKLLIGWNWIHNGARNRSIVGISWHISEIMWWHYSSQVKVVICIV